MKQFILLSSAIILIIALILSCKVNKDHKVKENQKLYIEYIGENTFSKGYYKNNKKTGIWYILKNDSIHTSIEYFDNDSSRNNICYYTDKNKTYCESTKYNQAINLEVLDSSTFSNIQDRTNIERIGFDLFLLTCSYCHKTSSYEAYKFNEKYKTYNMLSQFLSNSMKHGDANTTLNKYEIIAIFEYLNSLKISSK